MSSRRYLLDANVLIALSNETHPGFGRSREWFQRTQPKFATCPTTQGALIRFYCRAGGGAGIGQGKEVLRVFLDHPGHLFWPNDVSYLALPERGLRGHKQVTDFYLVALAGKNEGRLATLDASLAALFPEVCELI